jgi:hypothetical protein
VTDLVTEKVADLNVSSESNQKPPDVEKKKKNLLKKLRAIDDLQTKVGSSTEFVFVIPPWPSRNRR